MGFGVASCQMKSYGTQNLGSSSSQTLVHPNSPIQDEFFVVDIECLLRANGNDLMVFG